MITIFLIIADLIFSIGLVVIELTYKEKQWFQFLEIGIVVLVLGLLLIPILISRRRMLKVFTISYIVISLLYSCFKITTTIMSFNKQNNPNIKPEFYEYNFPIILLILLLCDTFFRIICFVSLKFFMIELKKRKLFDLRRKQESFIDKLGDTQEASTDRSIKGALH